MSRRPDETPRATYVAVAATLSTVLAVGVAVEFATADPGRDEAAASSAPSTPEAEETVAVEDEDSSEAALAGYPFSEDTLWREDVSDAPLHEDSEEMAEAFVESFADTYGGVASLNVREYNNSYYVADDDQPTTDVQFDDCQDKGYLPDGWEEQFSDVPIPEGAVPAAGRDQSLSIYSPSTDQLWEFWRAQERPDGWYACWGGRLDDVSTSQGIFEDNWGSTATGLANSAGMVRLADVRAGSIEHAVAIAIPKPADWDTFSWPAQRSDGWSDDPYALPEGIRLRLDDSVDVEALDLHPIAEMVAVAAQTYGFVVTDRAGTVAVTTESGQAERAETGTDPWQELLDDTPAYAVFEGFPWDEVEVLPVDYGEERYTEE